MANAFGGARYSTSAVDFDLNWSGARVHTVNPSAGSVDMNLPATDLRALGKGGPVFYVLNIGANALGIRDSASVAVVSVPAGDAAILTINAAGGWSYVLLDIL